MRCPKFPNVWRLLLKLGYHGQMGWMADRMHWRGNPVALWPEAKSVLMLAESYAPEHDPREVLSMTDRGAISVYAQNKDYHDLVKKRLKRLARWFIEEAGGELKVFVDTAPVPEKALGAAAGLGWQGKHTNLVSREWGNWAFLGSIFTTVELDPDAPEGRSLWIVYILFGCMSDQCVSCPISVGCAALYFLSYH